MLTVVLSIVLTQKVKNVILAGGNTIQNIHYAPFVKHRSIHTKERRKDMRRRRRLMRRLRSFRTGARRLFRRRTSRRW